ncbi:MAG: metallophosphoesterase family protein [Planctomycetota bacterium]
MKRFAIISDVHSNLDALLAVFEDFEQQGVEKVYCLGDMVGYGAHPREVVDIAMSSFNFVIRGNHDDAVTFKVPKKFNDTAARAVYWTRDKLKPNDYSRQSAFKRWDFLKKKLKDKMIIGNMIFAHGTPDSYFRYIDDERTAAQVLSKFTAGVKTLFVGHSHIPGIFEESNGAVRFLKWTTKDLPKLHRNRMIINVGSVGQPRDGDYRACYVVVAGDVFWYRRVEYDVELAVKAIYCRPGLPNDCGNRLRYGS